MVYGGSTGAQLWDDACGNSSKASYEVGPAVLLPNGTVFYTGASECNAGNIATYNWSTGTWTAQSAFPNKDAANDAPAAVETNGNAIVMTSPYSGTFSTPSTFYEWNGTTLAHSPTQPTPRMTRPMWDIFWCCPRGRSCLRISQQEWRF